MSGYRTALALVYQRRVNALVAVAAGLAALVLFSWSGQIVNWLPIGGLYLDLDPGRVAAIVAISAGFGFVVPVELEVFRRSRRSSAVTGSAGLLSGSVTGIAAMSCCSPVLLPAALALLGVSGTTALYFNLAVRRWFVPLALVALLLFVISGAQAARDLVRDCRIPHSGRSAR